LRPFRADSSFEHIKNLVFNVILKCVSGFIPKPVWAVGFALEQTLHVVLLTVFSYVDFKVASAYNAILISNPL
jgi:hypothetical protein